MAEPARNLDDPYDEPDSEQPDLRVLEGGLDESNDTRSRNRNHLQAVSNQPASANEDEFLKNGGNYFSHRNPYGTDGKRYDPSKSPFANDEQSNADHPAQLADKER